jgi:hypothetical protein
MVIARPDVVQTEGVDDVMTGVTLEVAEATALNVVADQVLVPGFVNEMVFEAF